MDEFDGTFLLHQISSQNYNKEGTTLEWHPMLHRAEADVEEDTMELGLRVAYYFYDENWWGEGAL